MKALMQDEQGSRSMARAMIVTWTVMAFLMVLVDFVFGVVPAEAYVLFGGVIPILIVWAAGPRMAQYLADPAKSAITGITGSISKLAQSYGGPRPGYKPPEGFKRDNEHVEGGEQ